MVEKKSFEIIKEGQEEILKIDANSWKFNPSIGDSGQVMAYAVGMLMQVPNVVRIIFNQHKNYEYGYKETKMLVEIANLYNHLTKQKKILSLEQLSSQNIARKHMGLRDIIFNLLKSDPIGAYVELKRILREERIKLKKITDSRNIEYIENYISLLMYSLDLLEKTSLISSVKDKVSGYKLGDRFLYQQLFRVNITPDFMFTKLMVRVPLDGEIIDSYSLDNVDVTIYKVPGDVKYLYYVNPPEFKLTEDEYLLVNLARSVLAEHKPKEEEFLDPERMRTAFFNIGKDLIMELCTSRNISIEYSRVEILAGILVRYTVGFGMIEILLQDPKIQDVVINSPIGQTRIFLVHQDYGECFTNIIPSSDDGESWATKFRLLSGRPLDEANPVLDTELEIPGVRARVAIIGKPLSPYGLAYAFRRHRDMPWTLPLFINNKMINSFCAGLLSFLIDGSRTILVAGTRSSGKTSFLGSILVEIMRKYRIITIEDTQELPVTKLREMGYNIQPMKVRSAITSGGTEVSADEGIRTSLRLGDSSLIVGEVRSVEAKALYEAMRVGALANVVAGTIHGDSPYSVYDRVVNDLEVPKTSFKATDLIIVCNPVKSPDGLKTWKRVVQVTEVRKQWQEDPLAERGFVDLMRYNPETDSLEPTADLINGDSEILKEVAGKVKEWSGDWNAVWENIMLRGKMKQTLVDYALSVNNKKFLEADFVIKSNDMFHKISEKVIEDIGKLDVDEVYKRWDKWLREQ